MGEELPRLALAPCQCQPATGWETYVRMTGLGWARQEDGWATEDRSKGIKKLKYFPKMDFLVAKLFF